MQYIDPTQFDPAFVYDLHVQTARAWDGCLMHADDDNQQMIDDLTARRDEVVSQCQKMWHVHHLHGCTPPDQILG